MSYYGRDAFVTGNLIKSYAQWNWYASTTSASFTGNTVVPSTTWTPTNISTPSIATSANVLQSSGAILIPMNGIYCIQFNVFQGNGSVNQANWWAVWNSPVALGVANNTNLQGVRVGVSVSGAVSSFTGYLEAGDILAPVTSSGGTTTITGFPGGANCGCFLIVSLLYQCP